MTWHYNWTNHLGALNSREKYDNAQECYNLLVHTYGWTPQAACAVIGNFENEGGLNPCQWQGGYSIGDWNNAGRGLGQWTPASKLADYMGGRTQADIANGAKQIKFTVETPAQWVQRVNSSGYSSYYNTGNIPYYTSINAFSQATDPTEDLATCWCACWEGCTRSAFRQTYTKRRSDAMRWYNEFSGSGTGDYHVFVSSTGNGTAYAAPTSHDALVGETFTVYAIPFGTDTLLDITAHEAHGTSVAVVVAEQHTYDATNFPYDVWFEVTFSGDTPTPPPPPPPQEKLKHLPIWMYTSLRIRRKNNG